MLQLKNSVVLVKSVITKSGQIVPNFNNHRCKGQQLEVSVKHSL